MGRKIFTILLGGVLVLAPAVFAAPDWLPGYRMRMAVEVVGDETIWNSGSEWVVASLPAGGWCRPDGADIQVQNSEGKSLPTEIISSNPEGSTIIQFKPGSKARDYWVYLGNEALTVSKRAPSGQAPTLEVRSFVSNRFESWPDALEALGEETPIQGNAILSKVRTYGNPFRSFRPGNFAAIYRGFLKIETAGTYRFTVRADDASFLFLNRKLVYEQTGRREAQGKVTEWYEVDLKPGLIPFEYFHLSGSDAKTGAASLAWKPPASSKWEVIPAKNFLSAPLVEVRSVEGQGAPGVVFVWGIEDSLVSIEASAYLTRFQAHGNFPNPAELIWDFGDGTKGTGASAQHIYFEPGEYVVTLQVGKLPPFRQRIFVDQIPVDSWPGALGEFVDLLAKSPWQTMSPARIDMALRFVVASGQPNRWKIQGELAKYLLAQKEIGGPQKARLYDALLEAMAEQGDAAGAVKLKEKMFADLGKSAGLRLQVMRSLARIHWKYLRNFNEASELYEQLLEENHGVKRPGLRRAAIEWGDMFLESGDLNRAEERYQMAATLGGEEFAATGQMKAIGRGALLRVAEQRLRDGKLRESRVLLERIEMEYPEQKMETLYRFLRAELDRNSGEYEEAIGNYEVLFKLPQGSSYRDRALAGIALSTYHQGKLKKSRELFEVIKNSYPDYFQETKLDAVVAEIDARLAAGKGDGKKEPTGFQGYRTDFSLGSRESATLKGLTLTKGLGMIGQGVVEMAKYSETPELTLKLELNDLKENGNYWVEIWYREQAANHEGPQSNCLASLRVPDSNNKGPEKSVAIVRTFGEWRKLGLLLQAPADTAAELQMAMRGLKGVYQFDGLRVLPVDDREAELFNDFIQGKGGDQ